MASPQTKNGYTKIANELLEAMASIKIPADAMRCFFVILRKTYGYEKKMDTISISQFQAMTGLPRGQVCRGISWLKQHRFINSLINETSRVTTHSIQKDYTKWTPTSYPTSLINETTDSLINETKSSLNSCGVGGLINETHKRKKKEKNARARASNFSLMEEIKTFNGLGWSKQAIKDHLLMREIPEADIDTAIGKLF